MFRSACRWLVALVLIASIGTRAAGQEPADPEAALTRAETLYGQSAFREAEEVLVTLGTMTGLTARQQARRLARLASVRVELGRYAEALATADEADEPVLAAGDPALGVRLDLVRGSAWRFRGFPHRGVAYYEQALASATDARRADLQSESLALLASVHQELSNWSRTLEYAERAYALRPDPSVTDRFVYLLNKGIAYYEFRDREAAHRAFAEAETLAREWGNSRAISAAVGELGLVAWEFDHDYELALQYFDEAMALSRAIGVPRLEATWLNNAGGARRDSGDLEGALAAYRRALAIEQASGGVTPALLKNLGQVLAALGRPSAEQFLRRAVDEADRQGVEKIRWQARMELGSLYERTDDDRARDHFAAAIDLLEAHQASVLLEGFRAGMLGRTLDQYDPYDRYVQYLLARDDADEAFAVSERARARIFLETLQAARDELAAAVPEGFRTAETDLLGEISDAQAALRTAADGAERRALLARVEGAEESLASERLRLASERPALAHARFPALWSLGDTRERLLAGDEALATYFLGQRASVAWIISSAEASVVTLPPAADIEAAVARLLPTLKSPAMPVDEDSRQWLSEALVEPLTARVPPGARVTIVPHGILHYVPFEALGAGETTYLVERNVVSYAPSVSSLAFLRTQPAAPARPVRAVAVGNPELTGPGAAEQRQGPLEWIGLLKPLPHSGREIRAVAASFGRQSQVLEGAAATEEALAAAVTAGPSVLHFATHALIDEMRPARSGLALTAGPGGSDGILQTREVYRLDLDAALVTLSACETALGNHVTGEGILGLSRAFFYAGADAVAASLWNVGDDSTADLMADFYRRIGSGTAIDQALADAKRALVAGPVERRHPYYWAPFIVSGDARTALPASSGPAAGRWVVGIGLVAALAVLVFIVRRRKTSAPRSA